MTASSVQAATPQAAVARTLVSVADIPATHRIAPTDEGWQQAETITNSCSTKVTTEWFRRARDKRRVVTGAAAKPSVTADHEVVAYDAPARGALAMHEYRAMAAACPPKMTLIIFGTTYDTRERPRGLTQPCR